MSKSAGSESLDLYMQFLHVALTHAKEAPTSQLDANERALMQAIALKDYAGECMTVMEAMAIKSLGAPATMHRRLARLRKLGVVATVTDGNDSRIKYLKITEPVHDYFARMGKALLNLNVR